MKADHPGLVDARGKELKTHGTTSFPAALYNGGLSDDRVVFHWHDQLEIGFLTDGCALLFVDGAQILLREGDGFFLNRNIPHSLESCEGLPAGLIHSIVFDPILIGGSHESVFWQRLIQPVIRSAGMPYLHLRSDNEYLRETLSLLKSAITAFEKKEIDYELEVRYRLSCTLSSLLRHLPAENKIQTRRQAQNNERILTMLSYIQKHFQENITVDKIADSAMISSSEALRCFHNTIGMTPVQYIKYYRIQRASEMLQSSQDKITDIAVECGFQEMSYFTRTFRRFMHMTPREYRKLVQK